MPTIEELPADTPVSSGDVLSEPSSSKGDHTYTTQSGHTFDRGGVSEELAERLMKQMQAGPDADVNSWLPGRSSKSLEETMKSFDSVPLFMKSLPELGDDENDPGSSGDKAALEALQSLAHEGPPDSVAQNFKGHGNEYFKGKRYREAIGFYTQAIDSDPIDDQLRLSLFLNRAACNLELCNYRQTLKDTSAALGINPKSSKAFYRAARALSSLGKMVEAIDCCDHGIQIDPKNTEMVKLREKVVQQGILAEKREKEREESTRRKRELDAALKRAFISRGLWIETSPRPPDNPSVAHFDVSSLPSHSSPTYPLIPASASSPKWQCPDFIRTPVIFPVMLLYPQHAQSDFVSEWHEDTTVGDHLSNVFPDSQPGPAVPWDVRGEYKASKLNAYASTHSMRLLKLGKKLTLREVMDQGASETKDSAGNVVGRDGLVLKDGILSLVVLPSGSVADKEWVDKFKKEREEKKAKGLIPR